MAVLLPLVGSRYAGTWRYSVWLSLMLVSQSLWASVFPVPFSAQTYQQDGTGATKSGRIFVQGDYVRTETQSGDGQEIRIHDLAKRVSYLLDIPRQQYQQLPDTALPFRGNSRNANRSPCEKMADWRCSRVGVDNISGRDAVEWEITITHGDRPERIHQWVDIQRGLVLRQLSDRGGYSQLEYLGAERLGDRATEKWRMIWSDGRDHTYTTLNWLDSELNLAIKELRADGAVRELRNIRTGPQKSEMFTIPPGYRKVETDRQ